MTQVLDFPEYSGATPSRNGRANRQEQDSVDDFWPDVSRQPIADDAPVDPINAPNRVLLEVFLVLAAAVGSVAAVSFLVPAISP